MYRIFGQLRVADAYADAARRETQQIFDTVDQGLFLIDEQFEMGKQHSQELVNIFADEDIGKRRFTNFLKKIVSSSDLDNVKRYMKLLFDPHKKQKLIASLNPLQEVSIQVKKDNTIENKFLRFNFMRVYNEKRIERVLTSVSDITKEVQLSRELEREAKRNDQQLEMVSAMMEADRTLMPIYLKNSEAALNDVNALLKKPAHNTEEFKDKARSMITIIHGIKGESSALSLYNISEICHEFEAHLSSLIKNNNSNVDGHAFVEPTVLLNKLMSYNTMLNGLFNNVFGDNQKEKHHEKVIDWSHLSSYARKVALRQGKNVNVQLSGLSDGSLDQQLISGINTISTQLIRNAISHGIEKPGDRELVKKKREGIISIALFAKDDGGYQYMFHDDGAGIDYEKLAARAIEKNLISVENAKNMSKNQLTNLIFSSRLSTSDDVDQDKGRGVGMDSVLQIVKQLSGSVLIKTGPVIGTTFIINFPINSEKIAATAA